MKNVWRVASVSLLLSLLGLVVVMREGVDLRAIEGQVRFSPAGVLVLLASLSAWWLLAGLRIKLLAGDMGGRVTLFRATRAYLLGLFSASVTPAATGTSVAIGWYLSRYLTSGQAVAIAVYTIALDLVFYAWSLPVSFLLLEAGGVELPVPRLGVYVVLVAAAALGLAWGLAYRVNALARGAWRLFGIGFLRRWRRGVFAFVTRTGRVMSSFARVPLVTQLALHATTAAMFLAHFLVLNGVALAMGLRVQHLNVLAVQTLVVALGFVVPTPGGSGYFEIALGVALTGQVPDQAKGLMILLWRVFSYYLYLLVGPAIGGLALLRATHGGTALHEPVERTAPRKDPT